ncbi:MAG: CoA synthetase [Candidatus Dormibacteraeota bacterium]|nr:CoA synthetase [Candidatus Dormibacteraeota bacterium]
MATLEDAAALVPAGACVGIGRLPPMSLVREMLRQGIRELRLITIPTGGLAEDLLIAAGAVRSLETSGVDLAEHGLAPNFTRAAEQATIEVIDSSCPATLMALQAGASGVSFSPVPGLFGSDLLHRRADWRVIDDPFADGSRVVLVPAISPDFALVHCLRSDPDGNLVTSIEFDDRLLMQAAKTVIATVEEISDEAVKSLLPDEQLVPSSYVDVVVPAPGGSLPIGCFGRFRDDAEALREYLLAARDPATMQVYLDEMFA